MTTVGIIGGTGDQGMGLGFRFARAGYDVVIGSRSPERAYAAATVLGERLGSGAGTVSGSMNRHTARRGDIVLLTVPYAIQGEALASVADDLDGKIVISCVNPLGFDKRGVFGLELGPTSAAEQAGQQLPRSFVVGAFHHLSARNLLDGDRSLSHEDVLVCGDHADSKEAVIELAAAITGRPGIDAGPLRLARQLEPLTAVLLSINRRYKIHSGIAVAGARGEHVKVGN